MIAKELINFNIPSLKISDSIEKAIDLMDFYKVQQLVVADNENYLGLISLGMLENQIDQTNLLIDLLPEFPNTFATEGQHLIELLNIVQQNNIEVIAVVDQDFSFIGSITKTDLVFQFSNLLGNELGAILVLAINERDYSLAEIARLVESNDTKILSSFYSKPTNFESQNTLTLKLNRTEIGRSVATLERFGYEIIASYASEPIESVEKERYDMLIKYLEM
jgi:acetoin utilization protein AcuB